jgi:hypothetical protein
MEENKTEYYFNWIKIDSEITLGIHSDKVQSLWIPKDQNENEIDWSNENFIEKNRLILGFLLFNIVILYN